MHSLEMYRECWSRWRGGKGIRGADRLIYDLVRRLEVPDWSDEAWRFECLVTCDAVTGACGTATVQGVDIHSLQAEVPTEDPWLAKQRIRNQEARDRKKIEQEREAARQAEEERLAAVAHSEWLKTPEGQASEEAVEQRRQLEREKQYERDWELNLARQRADRHVGTTVEYWYERIVRERKLREDFTG